MLGFIYRFAGLVGDTSSHGCSKLYWNQMIFHKSCIDWVVLEGKPDFAADTLPQNTIRLVHELTKALPVHSIDALQLLLEQGHSGQLQLRILGGQLAQLQLQNYLVEGLYLLLLQQHCLNEQNHFGQEHLQIYLIIQIYLSQIDLII